MKLKTVSCAIVALTSMLLVSCRSNVEEQGSEPGPRVENVSLALAIATVPSPFILHENQGDLLRFRAPGEAADGLLTFSLGPVEPAGINLIESVEFRKEIFQEMPGGKYFGNLELGTPLGTAFTARGAYTNEGSAVEEIWVYTIHPSANRLLSLTYTYPEGESQERMGHLIEILGEIEELESASPSNPLPLD